MSEKKLGQEPAFATSAASETETIYEAGMSKRFYAACCIAQSLPAPSCFVGKEETKKSLEQWAKKCFKQADALLKEENEV